MAEGNNKRIVSDKWFLGETLGKGGYGFVKCGYHIKTKKPFALKFMRKAEESERWAREQAQQVATEINALKAVDNKNVLKLFAYNLKCEYPEKNGNNFDTVLLVLELAPGGELFDILYYTNKLEPILARTYMDQLVNGLTAIHKAGIVHRDLKPQNLLLNKKFQLKITDFGLSKIFEEHNNNKVNVMKTAYVGTKGYQAPELLLKRRYTNKCDVFSVGVIMFILMTGYPPFEQADANDNWYRKVCQKKYTAFWNKHRGCGLEGDENDMPDARKLIEQLICYQPTERLGTDEIAACAWLQKQKYSSDELYRVMQDKHAKAVAKKKADPTKQEQLQTSVVAFRDIAGDPIPEIPKARENLPLATTFAIIREDGDEDPEQLKERMAGLLQLFKECVNRKRGRSTQGQRQDGDGFWEVHANCLTRDHIKTNLECYIMQTEIQGQTRQLLSFVVKSQNIVGRQTMVDFLQGQFMEVWDSNVDLSCLYYNEEEDDYDYSKDFDMMEALPAATPAAEEEVTPAQ